MSNTGNAIFSDDGIIECDDRSSFVPIGRDVILSNIRSLIRGNDHFGDAVPSESSKHDGSVLFWKMIRKAADAFSVISSFVSFVANQLILNFVSGVFLDSVGMLFGLMRRFDESSGAESDVSFRRRIESSHGCGSVDYVESATSRLMKILSIKDLLVLENTLSVPIYENGITLNPHSVYVAIDGDDVDDENLSAAMVFWDAKSCGSNMTPQIPQLESGLTYVGDCITDIETVPTTGIVQLFGVSGSHTAQANEVVSYASPVNTVGYAKLYKWDGTKWTEHGGSNIRIVSIVSDGIGRFRAVINRVNKKRFYVKAFVRSGLYVGDTEDLKEDVISAVKKWQDGEVDEVDGLSIGQDAIRYECGSAISGVIPSLKIFEVQFYNGILSLFGGYDLLCRYRSASDRSGVSYVHQDESLKFDSLATPTPQFYIDYSADPETITKTPTGLSFVGVDTDSNGDKVIRYSANVYAYTVPAGSGPIPVDANFVIYHGVEHGNDKKYYHGFNTLQDAFDFASDNDHIYMLKDVTTSSTAVFSGSKTVWFDMAGPSNLYADPHYQNFISHKYTFNGSPGNSTALRVSSGNLYVIDSSITTYDTSNGFHVNTNGNDTTLPSMYVYDTGRLIYDGPYLEATGRNIGIMVDDGGRLDFKYGKIKSTTCNLIVSGAGSSITVTGGEFEITDDNAKNIMVEGGSTTINGGYFKVGNGCFIQNSTSAASIVVQNGYVKRSFNNNKGSNGYLIIPSNDTTLGAVTITGGYFYSYYIGNRMVINGNPLFLCYRIYNGTNIATKQFSSGFYCLFDSNGYRSTSSISSSYVSGTSTQITKTYGTYWQVGSPTWVGEAFANYAGNQSYVNLDPPPLDRIVASAEAYDVYEDINVYLYVKNKMSGNMLSTYSDAGYDVSFDVNGENVSYRLPTRSAGQAIPTVESQISESGSKRYCDEVDVITVRNDEKAYCITDDGEVVDKSGITVYVQDYSGSYVSFVDIENPSIDTMYVPNENTKISFSFQFTSPEDIEVGQLIIGYSSRPKYTLESQGYALYVSNISNISNNQVTLTWRIGSNSASVAVDVNGMINAELSSTEMKITGYQTQQISIPSGMNFHINSIRVFKESEFVSSTTCPVRIYGLRISNGDKLRMNMVPFVTKGGRMVLLDRISGELYG